MQHRIGRMTAKEFFDLSKEFSSDLTIFYRALQDEALDVVSRAGKEGWSVERLEHEIGKLLASVTPDEESMAGNIVEKAYQVGTIRMRSDGKYQKQPDGEWLKIDSKGHGEPADDESSQQSSMFSSEEHREAVQEILSRLNTNYAKVAKSFPKEFDVHFAPDPANRDRVIISGESEDQKKFKMFINVKSRIATIQDYATTEALRGSGDGAKFLAHALPRLNVLGIIRANIQAKKANGTHYIAARMGAYKVFGKDELDAYGRQAINALAAAHPDKKFLQGDRLNVNQLMTFPEGRAFWKTHGVGMFMSWGTSETSSSMKRSSRI